MATVVKTYDPKKVIVTFGGVPISGFADGTFIAVKPASDTWVKKVGADGEVSRVKTNDDTSEVTLTLKATSPSNTYLTGVRTTDKLTGAGVLALTISDLSGTLVLFWPQAWIKKMPEVNRAKELGDTVWDFDTGQISGDTIGGTI